MASGVGVSDEVVTLFSEMKLRSKYKLLQFRINDELSEIILEKEAPPGTEYSDFVAGLPGDDCRYAVFDFDYTLEDGGKRNKLCFIVWCPDAAKIKKKMIYASSKDALRKKLVGVHTEIQATDLDELDYDVVHDKVSSGGTK